MTVNTPEPVSDWIDVLLPASGSDLNELGAVKLKDRSQEITLGPIDQAAIAFCERLLAMDHDNPVLVLQFPRGANEIAVTLGFALQALRLRAAQRGLFGQYFTFTGSIVVVGMDAAVQDRLRDVQVHGVSFARGLSGALSVSRVRHDGRIVDVRGSIEDFDPLGKQFLYLNARTGWPELTGERDGCVVVARNSMSSGDTFNASLSWAQSLEPRVIVVVDELGDHDTVLRVEQTLGRVLVVPLTSPITQELTYQLGHGSGSSTLTANALANSPEPNVGIRVVIAPQELDQALTEARDAVIHARKVNAPMPYAVARATRLFSTINRCVSDVTVYNKLAIDDPWAASMSSLNRRLERDTGRLEPKWHAFEQTRWAALRGGTLDAYKIVLEKNPKTTALVDLLDEISRRSDSPRVTLRVAGQTAAMATRATLNSLVPELVEFLDLRIVSWSERSPWESTESVSIYPAAPPVPLLPILWSGESEEKIFLLYRHEYPLLRSQWMTGIKEANSNLSESFRALGLGACPSWQPSLIAPSDHGSHQLDEVEIPGADLGRVLELMQILEAEQDAEGVVRSVTASGTVAAEPRILVPVSLIGGKTWWVDAEASVDVLVGGTYHQRLVTLLRSGDKVIIPRGDGRGSVLARLVAAHHRDADVADLDFLLLRFRKACRYFYELCGSNWAEVSRRLESEGASAVHQAKAWAEGTTLAPADPLDVRLIASLVNDSNLSEGWSRIAATAELLRSDHQSLGRLVSGALSELASGQDGPNMRNLIGRLGPGAAEVLDEFSIATVESVGTALSMAGSMTGSVR